MFGNILYFFLSNTQPIMCATGTGRDECLRRFRDSFRFW